MFHKKDHADHEGFAVQSSMSGPGPETGVSPDPVAGVTEHFSGLSVPQRAAEIVVVRRLLD